jgi:hypothetical protein
MTNLKIILGSPLHSCLVANPEYEVFVLKTSHLSGCDLDCSLAISVLTEGVLYLNFLPDGRLFSVSYESSMKKKERWSPTSNENLARSILQTKIPSWTGENPIEGLRAIVHRELGDAVDSLRIRQRVD